jgi:2-iminoacetate synthase ThiH
LQFGADDVGSILIEENVVYAAGVRNRTNEGELRRIISDAGYIPAQRDTLYRSYFLKQSVRSDPDGASPKAAAALGGQCRHGLGD